MNIETCIAIYFAGYIITMLIESFHQIRSTRQGSGYGRIYDYDSAFGILPVLWFVFMIIGILTLVGKCTTLMLEKVGNTLLSTIDKPKDTTNGDK